MLWNTVLRCFSRSVPALRSEVGTSESSQRQRAQRGTGSKGYSPSDRSCVILGCGLELAAADIQLTQRYVTVIPDHKSCKVFNGQDAGPYAELSVVEKHIFEESGP